MQIETQEYSSLREFVEKESFILPRSRYANFFSPWRLVKGQPVGEVQGLEKTMRGKLIATNGVLAVLKRGKDDFQIVHLAWFKPDKDEESVDEKLERQIRLAQAREGKSVNRSERQMQKQSFLQLMKGFGEGL